MKFISKQIVFASLILLSACFCYSADAAVVPNYLGYEGILTDSSDEAVTATYDITFRIYDAITDGSVLWTEVHSDVSVVNGNFSVQLGDTTTIDLDFEEQYFVTIEVESDG